MRSRALERGHEQSRPPGGLGAPRPPCALCSCTRVGPRMSLTASAHETAGIVLAGFAAAVGVATLVTVLDEGSSAAAHDLSPVTAMRPMDAADAPLGSVPDGVDPMALEQGRVYYVQLCQSCHGPRGEGRGEWAY